MKKIILSLIMAVALICTGITPFAKDLAYIADDNKIIVETDGNLVVLSFYDKDMRLCGASIQSAVDGMTEFNMPDDCASVRIWDRGVDSYTAPQLSPYIITPTPIPPPTPSPRPSTAASGGGGGGGTVAKPEVTQTPRPDNEINEEPTPVPTPEPTEEAQDRPKAAATNGIEKVKVHEGCYALVIDCRNAITDDASTEEIWAILPSNGIMARAVQYELEEDMTVYDALMLAAADNDLEIVGESSYVKAIGGIGEYYNVKLNPNATYKFVNKQSGWMYRVNGEVHMIPIDGYKIQDGDRIEIIYTCAYGDDLGEYIEW